MKKLSTIFCVVLWSCSPASTTEEWQDFYQKFHSDSLFQISRLSENFEGARFYGEIVEEITKDNWQFLPYGVYEVDTTQYQTEVDVSENKVETRIYVENSGIDIRLTYEKIKDKWFLVSFIDNFN
jgi:hypothetical protein